jgi:flagella basal body P-ring formation protein FlgA
MTKIISSKHLASLSLAALVAGLAGTAFAAPVLKSDVVVSSSVVTVGDMFDDAGARAEEALFRAPAPGLAGMVSLDAVRSAATRIGLVDYDTAGVEQVRVSRSGTVIDEAMLTALVAQDLSNRGIAGPGMSVEAVFDVPFDDVTAASVDTPAQLVSLRYLPANGTFSARFSIAGQDKPVDVNGKINLMVEVPHLVSNLAAGAILTPADIEMRKVTVQMAESNGLADISQLVGKQLQRQSRQGMMLRPADVVEPQLVSRNETVTVYFRAGAMTLTVKGQALNAAAKGQDVAVLNLTTKKVVHGQAMSQGAVEINSTDLNVAGL